MAWSEPGWLWALVPWSALVVVVLRGYRPHIVVPYLDLWPRDDAPTPHRRRWRIPPVPVLLILLSVLTSVISLAGPSLPTSLPRLAHLKIVVDRGLSMLAGDRLAKVSADILRELPAYLEPDASIEVVEADGARQLVGPQGLRAALEQPAQAIAIDESLAVTLRRLEQEDSGPILVISARPAGVSEHILATGKPGRLANVGIVSAAAREGHLLLRLRNDSFLAEVSVVLKGGRRTDRRTLKLPEQGGEREYVLVWPETPPLSVTLDVSDDLAEDNLFWILPERLNPRLDLSPGLPESLERFAASYAAARPPAANAPVIHLVSEVASAAPASILVQAGDVPVDPSSLRMADHPLLSNVRLPDRMLAVQQPLPSGDWQVILSAGTRPLLAVDEPNRRVWVGFSAEGWDREIDYPIFWTNLIEFITPSPGVMATPHRLEASWKRAEGELPSSMNGLRAGLYERGGEKIAIHVPAPQALGEVLEDSWEQQLRQQLAGQGRRALSPYGWLVAGLLAGLAGVWVCVHSKSGR